MERLEATWTPEGRLFFWGPHRELRAAVRRLAPELADHGQDAVRQLASPAGAGRVRVVGLDVALQEAIGALAILRGDVEASDSVWCWSLATKLALELASRHRLIPTVGDGAARWRALLTRRPDRERFDALVAALPANARAVPVGDPARPGIRLRTAEASVRDYVDQVLDTLHRTEAWPGPARGWVLELAEALRSQTRSFQPREGRHQAIPGLLANWAREAVTSPLRVGLAVELPRGEGETFSLRFFLHAVGAPDRRVWVTDVWGRPEGVNLDGVAHRGAAFAALRGIARAAQLHRPLLQALEGPAPRDLAWGARAVWQFIESGAPALAAAGIEVSLPEAFADAGDRRIRARMRISWTAGPDGRLDLGRALGFLWEIALGDLVLAGEEFAELVRTGEPIVKFRGRWVLLDPSELARLPHGLPHAGTLPAADALRAILSGEHDGVPVVADDHLAVVLEALRHPPEQPPPPGLLAELRPYQVKGFSWLVALGSLGLGCCLADDMGLGKTVQLVAYLLHRQREGGERLPTLVVCPTSVLGNWERELARFAPSLVVRRHHGVEREIDELHGADVVLTTYGLLVRDREALSSTSWDVAVLDEAQSIKNPDSHRARVARTLRARHRIALTGTPVENRLEELWSVMDFLLPGLLGTRGSFVRNVAVPIERFGDQAIARTLRLGVSPFLLRRLKSDPAVISDLPDKIEKSEYTPLTPEQARLYRRVTEEALAEIADLSNNQRRGRVLALLTALKQVCNHPEQFLKEGGPLDGRSGKLERCLEILEAILERGERVLVFTQYREMGKLLQRTFEERLGEAIPFLHGGTPPRGRDAMVADFQEKEAVSPILLISLKAGGTGLNLTRASHVIHYDRWWNPAVEDQATDRAYRIGQHRNVQVHKLVCQGTLEERVDSLLREKRALAESVVGVGEQWVTELDDEALRKLVLLSDDAVVEG